MILVTLPIHHTWDKGPFYNFCILFTQILHIFTMCQLSIAEKQITKLLNRFSSLKQQTGIKNLGVLRGAHVAQDLSKGSNVSARVSVISKLDAG